jgi:tetratricopeptide (TPR) repeat protein
MITKTIQYYVARIASGAGVRTAVAILVVLLTLVTTSSGRQRPALSSELEAAQQNLSQGKFREVIDELQPVLAKNRANPHILMILGVAEDHLGLYTDANKHFQAALVKLPNCASCWVNIGVNYSHLDQPSKAAKAFLQAIRLEPKLPNAYFNLGQVYFDQGKSAAAARALESARRIAPQDFGIGAELAQCYFKLKDTSALDRLLKEISTSCGADVACQLQVAALLASVGQVETAKQRFEQLRKSNPGSPRVLYQEALLYYQLDDLDHAAALLAEVSEAGPARPSVDELLGSIAARRGNYGEAIAHFREAAKAQPDERNLFNLAYTLYINAQFEEAKQLLTNLTREFPRSSRTYLSLGAVNQELGKYPESVEAYKKVLSLQPNSATAYLFLGDVQMLSSNYPSALKNFRRAVELAPGLAEAQYYLGLALMESGSSADVIEAVSRFRLAVKQDPSLVAAQVELGKGLLRQGQQKEALETLEKAVKMDPESAQAHYLLAQCYRRQGQSEQAEYHLGKFKELKSKSDENEVRLQRSLLSTAVAAPRDER